MHPKNKRPLNKKNQKHGYWESYLINGTLVYKVNYINGIECGYEEWSNGEKRYYAY